LNGETTYNGKDQQRLTTQNQLISGVEFYKAVQWMAFFVMAAWNETEKNSSQRHRTQ
jgi:hypothetical protein